MFALPNLHVVPDAGMISFTPGSATGSAPTTRQSTDSIDASAASNAACGFPALRSPVLFASRLMGPILPEPLSARVVLAPE